MALSGSIEIEGLEITGSYTNVSSFSYNKKDNLYNIGYTYNIYVSYNHRISNPSPLYSDTKRFLFQTTGSVDPFDWIYNNIRTQPYFVSSSLIDC